MLIILFPYKFSNFFFKKYQINELIKKFKKNFEIHDISNIIAKNFHNELKRKNHKAIQVFDNINEWKTHIQKKIQKKKKIFVINLVFFHSFRSFYIHYLLFKYKVSIIKINSPEVFAPISRSSIYLKLISFLKLILFDQTRLIFILKNLFIRKLVKSLKFNELYVTICGFKSKKLPSSLDISAKKIRFIDFHASDFANYLSNKPKNNLKKKNYVIFLDIKAPAFAGDDILFNNPIKYDVDKWYKDLNNFLINVEKIFKTKVIIIPHPSVRKLKNMYYHKQFKVSKNPDSSNQLIPNSRFVIANGATTAVSFCIIHNKPVTLIYADQVKKFNPGMLFETKCLSSCLSVKSLNINKKIYKSKFSLKINKKSYSNYKYNFLTSKSIKKINNPEILEKIITQ